MAERQAAPACCDGGPAETEVTEFLSGLDQLGPGAADGGGNLIGLLQQVQERFGYLPASALDQISRRTRTPLSRIYGVVSFYAQFYTEPRGKHTIRCCRGTACHVRGAGGVLDAVRRTLGIEEGQSTPDLKFYLETVACVGACFLAPVMMIDEQYYGKLTARRIETIIENY